MTPEEAQELKTLNYEKDHIRTLAFSMFREWRRADEEALKFGGHKSKEAALLWVIEDALQKIAKMEEEFLRRWSD